MIGKIITIPKNIDERGILSYMESNSPIFPYDIKRIFFIYGLTNKDRGFHANKKNNQILFCLSGNFEIELDSGKEKKSFILNSPNKGIFIPNMTWHKMYNFGINTIIVSVSSEIFSENDYIRDYNKFINIIKNDK